MRKFNIDINKFYTTKEIAEILGVSRVTAFNRVKKGILKAELLGGSYVVKGANLQEYVQPSEDLSDGNKELINQTVKRVIKEYGVALKKLGKEE